MPTDGYYWLVTAQSAQPVQVATPRGSSEQRVWLLGDEFDMALTEVLSRGCLVGPIHPPKERVMTAEDNVADLARLQDRYRPCVYALLYHGVILGVLSNQTLARAEADSMRLALGGTWRQETHNSWRSERGSMLEISAHTVR